jgi:hypothetical protein
MMTTKPTQSEQTGINLIDKDCVLLDGHCDCWIPLQECTYLKEKKDDLYVVNVDIEVEAANAEEADDMVLGLDGKNA